ncbi:MAG: hypothetical protein AMS16_07555, partial [Planctomycetes bacterium DG_58]
MTMAEIPMTWVLVSGIVSMAVVAVGVVFWRRDGWPLVVLIGVGLLPGLLVLLAVASGRRHVMIVQILRMLDFVTAAIIGYTVFRVRPVRFGPWAACCGGVVTALLAFPFGMGFPVTLLLSVAAAVVVALVAWVIRFAFSREGGTTVTIAGEEERQAVLKMMGEGKISSAEARELLNAMRGPQPSGDSLP